MIYFDNAATGGRKPDSVISAVLSAVKVCANPGRSGHKLSVACAKQVLHCRNTLNHYFDGYGFDRVIFTKNCTEALNIALLGVLQPGDHVIVSCMEHNSVLRPIQHLATQGVITYSVCPLTNSSPDAELDLHALKQLITPNTRLVAITAASNVTGLIPDLTAVRKMIPKETLLLCDGAQGCGHLDLKMKGAGIDLLALAGHKGMLGIQGSGALLFSERIEPSPILFGGTGSISLSLDMPDFYPDRLEAGTISYPSVISLMEGTRYLIHHQQESSAKILSLTEYFLRGLKTQACYTAYSKPNPCGIVTFRHERLQSEYIAETLSSKYSIAVRGGLHCAPLMHEELGTLDGGLVRVSFSHYNHFHEIDALLRALQEINQYE